MNKTGKNSNVMLRFLPRKNTEELMIMFTCEWSLQMLLSGRMQKPESLLFRLLASLNPTTAATLGRVPTCTSTRVLKSRVRSPKRGNVGNRRPKKWTNLATHAPTIVYSYNFSLIHIKTEFKPVKRLKPNLTRSTSTRL